MHASVSVHVVGAWTTGAGLGGVGVGVGAGVGVGVGVGVGAGGVGCASAIDVQHSESKAMRATPFGIAIERDIDRPPSRFGRLGDSTCAAASDH